MKTYYIIYKITNVINNKIYIGAHKTTNLNDQYMGSGKHLKNAIIHYGIENFQRKIIYRFENEMAMSICEEIIVNKEFINRNDTYNEALGGYYGWKSKNRITAKDKNGNIFWIFKDDSRFLSGELVGITNGTKCPGRNKNMVVAKDIFGNHIRVHKSDKRLRDGTLIYNSTNKIIVKDGYKNIKISVDDPRYLSGELKHVSKGLVPVKDKDGTTMSVSVDDPRYLSGELKHVSKGLVPVKDKDGNFFAVNKSDPRYISGELKHNTSGLVRVKDKYGNRYTVSTSDNRYLSGEFISVLCGTPITQSKDVNCPHCGKLGKARGMHHHIKICKSKI